MKECAVFVFLLLFQSVVMTPPDKFTITDNDANCYYSYHISFGSRPRPNRVLNITDANSMPYPPEHIRPSRHHIIPFQTLRGFYNRLIGDESNFRYFFEHVLQLAAEFVGRDLRTYENLIVSRRYPLEDLPDILRNHIIRDLDQHNQENLARELYVWLPFNIFFGPAPNARADDPSHGIEEDAHVMAGWSRVQQLRQMYDRMNAYINGDQINPEPLIYEMGDLLRTTQLPYDFNPNQWRIHISSGRFVIATPERRNNRQYRQVERSDLCPSGQVHFHRDDRVRRDVKQVQCLVQDSGAIHDPYCIKSLDLLRTLIQEKVLILDGTELVFDSNEIPSGPVPAPPIKSPGCNFGTPIAGGILVGAGGAAASCLLAGGVLIPGAGWAACGVGSLAYALGGFVLGSSLALARCKQ